VRLNDARAIAEAARQAGEELRQLWARSRDIEATLLEAPPEVVRMLIEVDAAMWPVVLMVLDLEPTYSSAAVAADRLAARAEDPDEVTSWHMVADYCRFVSDTGYRHTRRVQW